MCNLQNLPKIIHSMSSDLFLFPWTKNKEGKTESHDQVSQVN